LKVAANTAKRVGNLLINGIRWLWDVIRWFFRLENLSRVVDILLKATSVLAIVLGLHIFVTRPQLEDRYVPFITKSVQRSHIEAYYVQHERELPSWAVKFLDCSETAEKNAIYQRVYRGDALPGDEPPCGLLPYLPEEEIDFFKEARDAATVPIESVEVYLENTGTIDIKAVTVCAIGGFHLRGANSDQTCTVPTLIKGGERTSRVFVREWPLESELRPLSPDQYQNLFVIHYDSGPIDDAEKIEWILKRYFLGCLIVFLIVAAFDTAPGSKKRDQT
jgi:hypothetical protein